MVKTTAIFFGSLALAFSANAQGRKLSPEFDGLDPNSRLKVIVKWKKQPDARNESKILKRGGMVRTRLASIAAGEYELSARNIHELANDPDIQHISIDHPVRARLDNTANAMNASAAWSSGFVGTGVGVAVLDSGMNASADLAGSRVVHTEDFVEPNAPVYGQDLFGHGQHVAGIIGANGSASACTNCTRTLKGIAPGVNLINFRVLDANGEGTDGNVIAALQRAVELKDTYNIRVVNLSLGRPVYESYQEDPLCQAVEAAWKAGIVVVVAAGTEGRDYSFGTSGYGTINVPANDPYVITVGAMKAMGTPDRSDDLIGSYSSKVPSLVDHVVKPDILAAGNQVVSLMANGATLEAKYGSTNSVSSSYYLTGLTGTGAAQPSSNYFVLSGTSMAAAAVSGAVADLIQARPELTPDQVKLLIMGTAYRTFPQSSSVYDTASGQTFTSYYDIFTVGAGYLDLGAALAAIDTL